MLKHKVPLTLKVALPGFVGGAISVGIYLSYLTKDPHWLNRTGALIAAGAAVAIIVQISSEIQLEHERENVDARIELKSADDGITLPLDDLAKQLEINRLKIERIEIAHRRLIVAIFVVISAMIGELLHGFGDLLMCYGLNVCGIH